MDRKAAAAQARPVLKIHVDAILVPVEGISAWTTHVLSTAVKEERDVENGGEGVVARCMVVVEDGNWEPCHRVQPEATHAMRREEFGLYFRRHSLA